MLFHLTQFFLYGQWARQQRKRIPACIMLRRLWIGLLSIAVFSLSLGLRAADDLPRITREAKPAVLAVGTYQPLRNPAFKFAATGFVVGDGFTLITNAHAIPLTLDLPAKESLAVARPKGVGGTEIEVFLAESVRIDRADDLAVLRFKAEAGLPTLKLAESTPVEPGTGVALIGYPIGLALGLIGAVHRGTIAAHAPMALPKSNSNQVDARAVLRLREGAQAFIYQLDAVAYPGNSGSPLLSLETGEVIGIINAGWAKNTREAITTPSGISYAVPVSFLHRLLNAAK